MCRSSHLAFLCPQCLVLQATTELPIFIIAMYIRGARVGTRFIILTSLLFCVFPMVPLLLKRLTYSVTLCCSISSRSRPLLSSTRLTTHARPCLSISYTFFVADSPPVVLTICVLEFFYLLLVTDS